MSEQKKKSFMQELDEWTDAEVIRPLFGSQTYDSKDERTYAATVEQVKKAIRAKVLESYRNGQKAPERVQKFARGGQR